MAKKAKKKTAMAAPIAEVSPAMRIENLQRDRARLVKSKITLRITRKLKALDAEIIKLQG